MSDITFTKRDDVYLLADLCEVFQPEYDFILIDSHPARNILLNMLYVASDYVIASTLSDERSMSGVESLEADLRDMRESRNKLSHAYILTVILARYKQNDTTCKKAMNTLGSLLLQIEGSPFLETVRESNRVSMARGMGIPVQEYERYNNAAMDYRRIAKRIMEVCADGERQTE
jgi:chromosome partitioning protein